MVFDVIPSHFSEVPPPEHLLRPQDLVIANAKGKALDVGMRLSQVREAPVESRLGFCEGAGFSVVGRRFWAQGLVSALAGGASGLMAWLSVWGCCLLWAWVYDLGRGYY